MGADAKDRDREYVFMSIDRSEYVSLSDYIKTKEITMKNLPEPGSAAAYGGGAKGRMVDLLGQLEGEGGEDSADESGSGDDDYEGGNSSHSGDSDDSGASSDEEGSGNEGGSLNGDKGSKVWCFCILLNVQSISCINCMYIALPSLSLHRNDRNERKRGAARAAGRIGLRRSSVPRGCQALPKLRRGRGARGLPRLGARRKRPKRTRTLLKVTLHFRLDMHSSRLAALLIRCFLSRMCINCNVTI